MRWKLLENIFYDHIISYIFQLEKFSFIALGKKDGHMSPFWFLFLLCGIYGLFWKTSGAFLSFCIIQVNILSKQFHC